jgi:hypothetical protein
MQHNLGGIACLAILLVASTARTTPQDRNQPGPSAEQNAYQAAHNEKDGATKIKLLDDFAAHYPASTFLQDAYLNEYKAYFSLGNYPETADYVDKFLVFGAKIDSADRLEALVTRAEAFLAGCVDATLRTPEAYGSAKAAATSGLQALAQLPKSPDCVQPGPCRSERNRVQSLFSSVAGIAESGLKGESVESCKGPGSPAMFDHVIDDLKQQERHGPRVR